MRRIVLPLTISLVVLIAACGKNSGSPTAPGSGPFAGGTATGATISGTVSAGSAATASTVAHTAGVPGLTVSVVGTNLSSAVDGSNHFVLQNVPDGDRQLRFSGSGIDAQVSVAGVQTSETITLAVNVSGTSATIDSQTRSTGGDQEIEGRIEGLPPTTAAGAFVIAGQTVLTDGGTQYFRGDQPGSFSDLVIGIRAHVKARMSGGSLLASLVQIQNTIADIPVEINGVIHGFSGTTAAFQMTINNRLLKGDSNTTFFGNTVFADIANDLEAEVKGQQQNGFVYITRMHVNVPDNGQDVSASIEGTLTAKSGGIPLLTLTVGGTTVTTTASTEVRRRGDVQPLTTLALGMTLHVEGIRQSNGSLVARMIQIKDDETGALVEIEGSLGGLKGTCPAISFSVNGYAVVADSSTTFTPACSTLKSGSHVTVNGTMQANGSIKATSVK